LLLAIVVVRWGQHFFQIKQPQSEIVAIQPIYSEVEKKGRVEQVSLSSDRSGALVTP